MGKVNRLSLVIVLGLYTSISFGQETPKSEKKPAPYKGVTQERRQPVKIEKEIKEKDLEMQKREMQKEQVTEKKVIQNKQKITK